MTLPHILLFTLLPHTKGNLRSFYYAGVVLPLLGSGESRIAGRLRKRNRNPLFAEIMAPPGQLLSDLLDFDAFPVLARGRLEVPFSNDLSEFFFRFAYARARHVLHQHVRTVHSDNGGMDAGKLGEAVPQSKSFYAVARFLAETGGLSTGVFEVLRGRVPVGWRR